ITLIGQALNVAHVLEGSIRKQGERVRITAQLIQCSDGYHLWSDTYDGDLSDIFDLQDSISRSIVQELEVILEGNANQRLATNLTNSPQAYEYFLHGRQLVHQQSGQQTLPKAVDLLEKAVGLDPGFVEAWAWLADANYTLVENSLTPHWRDHLAAANRAVGRAEELDPALPMVMHAAGYRASLENRLDKVIAAYQRGHDLDASDPELRFSIGMALAGIGQIEQGHQLMEEVLSEQPLIGIFHQSLGNTRFALGRYEDAKRAFQRSIDMGNTLAAICYAFLLGFEGHQKAAADLLDKYINQLPPTTLQLFRIPFSRPIFYAAALRGSRLAAWMAIMSISTLARMPFIQPNVSIPGAYFYLGAPKLFLDYFRKHSSIYTLASMIFLWIDTEEARRIRTHRDFPQFAEDFGLVRAWRKYG
ncbi:MAG: hypothetical protein O3B72_07075, partial [Proteobacteria bacterium]|nr:hypothetical protein [Pseudomonadota bacterium]